MAKRTKNRQAKDVLQRLFEDEEAQGHLRTGATRLHEAWNRASQKRSKAVEDKKVYDKVREAATSLTKAARRIGKPPEKPKKNRGKVVIVLATAGGAAYAISKRQSSTPVQS